MYLPEKGYKRFFVIVLYLLLAALFLYFIFTRLLGYILPFVIGWFIAYMIQRPVKFLKTKLKIPKKISSFILVMLIVSAVLTTLVFSVSGIISELESFTAFLSDNAENISGKINSFFDSLPEKLGPLTKFFDSRQLNERINGEMSNLLTAVIAKLPSVAASIAAFMPKILIFTVILIISSFYLSCDFHNINSFIINQFPGKTKHFIKEFKNLFLNVIGKFLRAYLMIALITFTELYLGFTVIGVKYSFTIALITCLIDILPVFGSGLVIVPWALFSFLSGNISRGISLAVLYIIISVARQFIEPKVIGSFIGLHPLVALMSLFLGLALLGVPGMFLLPVIAIILKTMNDNGTIKLYKSKKE